MNLAPASGQFGTMRLSYTSPMQMLSTLLVSVCYSEDSDRSKLLEGGLKACLACAC